MTNLEIAPSRSLVRIVLALLKPRIIELLLVTAIPALILASKGWPQWGTLISVIGFGTMAAAGANAWNSIIERDIDAVMNRTKHRPLVTGELSITAAKWIASVFSIGSVLGMYFSTNFSAAALTAAAIGFYVLGYTILLKPRTDQNIVWGGIAGCFPVVIAESAVTGQVSMAGWTLFALIFFWTPAHYWPLAAHFKSDYSKANIPMLPVVKSPRIVARWTLVYSLATIAVSFAMYFVVNLGMYYLTAATLSGLVLFVLSLKYLITATDSEAKGSMELFHYSISYLSVIFLALAVDILL